MKKNTAKKMVAAKSASNANINPKTGKPYSARQLTAIKNGKTLGRPPGAFGNQLVTLETLSKLLPGTAQIPVSARYLKAAGLKIEVVPFQSNASNLKTVAESYKAQAQATVVDLNESAENTETLATV
jgi:hypothetical protein